MKGLNEKDLITTLQALEEAIDSREYKYASCNTEAEAKRNLKRKKKYQDLYNCLIK